MGAMEGTLVDWFWGSGLCWLKIVRAWCDRG